MVSNLEKFIKYFPDNIDAALVTDSSNRYYLLGFDTSDAGTLVVTRKKAYFIIDSRYIELAKRNENEFLEVILQKDLLSQVKDICFQENTKCLGIETQTVPVSEFYKLNKIIGDIIDTNVDINSIIMELRAIKNDDEIEKIRQAQKITDGAFKYILGRIREGKTEKELALELEFYMRSNGARATAFDIVFVGGKNCSLPHGVPTDYRLKKGDFITIDFGADIDGYKSDMTRTIAIGSVSDEQKMVYETVLLAQETALGQIKAGKCCSDIDKISRDIIAKAGYGECFGHALGHGVGLDIHEAPALSPNCKTVLKPGMIITVEPGIYLPEKFGVRIEDMVLITENGIENLTKSKKSLIII